MKLSDEHREALQEYIDFYKGRENVYGQDGWAMPLCYAIEAALARIDGSGPPLSAKQAEVMQRYVEYYKPKEEAWSADGLPRQTIAHAVEAALAGIDDR